MDRASTLVIYQRILITKIINLKDKMINKQNITKEKLSKRKKKKTGSSCIFLVFSNFFETRIRSFWEDRDVTVSAVPLWDWNPSSVEAGSKAACKVGGIRDSQDTLGRQP